MLSRLLHHPRLRTACIACTVLIYLLIVVAGNVPGARADIGRFAPGIVLHAGAYGLLACLCFLAGRGSPRARAIKAVLAAGLMGAGDEFIQGFFPYRGADVRDWAVDCVAACTAVLALHVLLRKLALDTGR